MPPRPATAQAGDEGGCAVARLVDRLPAAVTDPLGTTATPVDMRVAAGFLLALVVVGIVAGYPAGSKTPVKRTGDITPGAAD